MKNKEYIDYIIIALLSIVSLSIIFNNLGSSTLYEWDESRNAENALEILKTNDWIVLKYGGQPELWNVKPPLGAWLIAISFKIFGFTEFALRFWSAFFAVGTIILVYLFGLEIENRCAGIFSAILLLTNKSFIGYHGARTGDYDVMVTFFITLSLYFFYLSQKREERLFLIGTAVAAALAVLTKGVIGLFPAVIIGIYLLYFKSLRKTILTKETGYAIFSFFVLVLPWFIYRFILEKDFFITMFEYDLLKRLSEPIEEHVGDWSFYLVGLQWIYGKIGFALLVVIFILSIYLLVKSRNEPISLLVIWISVFMVVFTVARTKIFWYIIPLYPAISLLIAYNFNILQKSAKINKTLFMLIFLTLMIFPVLSTIKLTPSVDINPDHQSIKLLQKELNDINILYIHSDENSQSTFFYLNSYVKGKVNVYNDIHNINASKGDGIITFNLDRFNILAKSQDYKLIKANKYIALFEKI